MSDFSVYYNTFQDYLKDEFVWGLVDNNVFSINNMDDRELREAILGDLLGVTMWEKQHNERVHFGFTKLLRLLPRSLHKRVKKQMKHDDIVELISIRPFDVRATEVRIVDNSAILQAAMDYAGIWYSGFNIPPDAICLNTENLAKAVEEHGSLENLASSLAMDLIATNPSILTEQ